MDGSRLWSDLPQDIVGLTISKLHFPNQSRALAVCKSWRDCKDYVRSLNTLPWVVHYDYEILVSHLNCRVQVQHIFFKLLNPYSQEVHRVPNSMCISPLLYLSVPLASKQGWLLFSGSPFRKELLLYNPFINDTHCIPAQKPSHSIKATIIVDPKSGNVETFLVTSCNGYPLISSYKAGDLTTDLAAESYLWERIHSVLYMKGSIYCLVDTDYLYSYSLEDKSWKAITSLPDSYAAHFADRNYWLLEINENLIMVVADFVLQKCKLIMIFRFDWSEMSWVIETGLKSCAIYISGHIAYSTPLQNRSGEKLEGCRVFYLHRRMIKCYSVSDTNLSEIHCEEYGWIQNTTPNKWSFIEPPCLGI